MRIVTVAARDQAFIHLVMERSRETGLDFQMAAITELRLCCRQQLPRDVWVVDGMAISAADVVFEVLGAKEVRVLLPELVAPKTSL